MGSSGSTEHFIDGDLDQLTEDMNNLVIDDKPLFDIHYRYTDLHGEEHKMIHHESPEFLIRALGICAIYLSNGYPAFVMQGDEKFNLESVWVTNYTFVNRYYKKFRVNLSELDFLKEEIFPEPSTSNLFVKSF